MTEFRIRMSSLAEAPRAIPPPALLWRYAMLFGEPVAYCVTCQGEPQVWMCGSNAEPAPERLVLLPEQMYGVLPISSGPICLESIANCLCGSARPVEMRFAPSDQWRAVELGKYHCLDTFLLESRDLASAEQALTRDGRQNLRRAESRGVGTRVSLLREDSHVYYELYLEKCFRLRSAPKPKKFFDSIAELFGDSARLSLAALGDRCLATVLFVQMGEYAILADGSSSDTARTVGASSAAVWKSLQFCRSRGVRTIDFGTCAIGDKGNARFKMSFGARRVPIYGWTS